MSVARPGFYSPIDNAFHGTGGFSEMIYDLAARTAAPATITDFYNWGAPTLVVDIHATAKTATPSITKMYRREQVYHLAGFEDIAPDLIVGYAKGTRGSDESALGELPAEIIVDNRDAWSGDHCMDPSFVPGILITSKPLPQTPHNLQTLAPAILAEFGISGFPAIR